MVVFSADCVALLTAFAPCSVPRQVRTSFCLFNDFIGSSIKGYMISAVVIIINFGRIQASKMLVLKVGLQLDLEIFMML